MSRLALASLLAGTLLCCASIAPAAEHGEWMRKAGNDLGNLASLQRGAKYYVNYCLGCHSARYVRYSRVAEDLGISQDRLAENLMFTADKPQRTMEIAMPAADAKRWFGRAPPDLSLVARSRGTDWIYNYLHSFYVDESKPWGVDNLVLPGAAMPDVLWELRGTQRAVFHEETDAAGHAHQAFERFEPVTAGRMSAAEFDLAVRDVTNFLAYVGEPMQLERRELGLKVLGFLLVLFVLAYLLKKEYWKDVH